MADNESYNLAYVGLNQREQNLFREEYYSGTDTKIYFDDVEQKEISYINYTIQEQLLPIFGYSSRTFDTVAVGNRVVNGTFIMPIRNPERIATVNDVISGAKNGFEKNEEYNNLETNKLKENDWINESTNSVKTDDTTGNNNEVSSSGNGSSTSGNNSSGSSKTDGAGHIYDGTAADKAWHEGQKYQEYLDSQNKKEKSNILSSTDTTGLTDAEYMQMLKKIGYDTVLDFQKKCGFLLENNGILDNNTKELIITSSCQQMSFPNGGLLMSAPDENSTKVDILYPTGYNGSIVYNIKTAGPNGDWLYVMTEKGLIGYVYAPDLGQG